MSGMQFYFADACDYVDPRYDFLRDSYSEDREVQRDDQYPHELLGGAPYDGILVSRAIVGDDRRTGKYSTSQLQRFRRDGAHRFLRYEGRMMGDCGAFSYAKAERPPYEVPEMVDYYLAAGFDLAVSIDHVILGYDESLDQRMEFAVPDEWRRRYALTLQLAEEFRRYCTSRGVAFQPIGVAQGWSPRSYRDAVRQLVKMGYDYVAIGGVVPLKVPQIEAVLRAVRDAEPRVRLHLFGFTKADDIEKFVPYGIESFDSTSPMLRAFKDGKRNYLLRGEWYTALRVPDASECRRFKDGFLANGPEQRKVRQLEHQALGALRDFDAGKTGDVESVVRQVMEYSLEFAGAHHDESQRNESRRQMALRETEYRKTLERRPWQECSCPVCRAIGIEVIIFRGNNRNRRRGAHNLWEFHGKLRNLRQATGMLETDGERALAHA